MACKQLCSIMTISECLVDEAGSSEKSTVQQGHPRQRTLTGQKTVKQGNTNLLSRTGRKYVNVHMHLTDANVTKPVTSLRG
eukprot:2700941-Pleurochrysis_carterae.AAC.2